MRKILEILSMQGGPKLKTVYSCDVIIERVYWITTDQSLGVSSSLRPECQLHMAKYINVTELAILAKAKLTI